jgi:membrane protein DedA with SNARE-associated domain
MVFDPDLVLLLTTAGLLALATLVSEDLACITAGALVAQGSIGFVPATLACFIGILGGDLLLFLAGRSIGRPLLAVHVVRRALSEEALQRSTAWLNRHGAAIVLASRFLPGTRLATCVAAGALGSSSWALAGWFAVGAALWTPLIVGAATVLEAEVARSGILAGSALGWRIALAAITLAVLARLLRVALSCANGRAHVAVEACVSRIHAGPRLEAVRGFLDAYRTLVAQWRLAFEIGADKRRRGAGVWKMRDLAQMVRRFRARARVSPNAPAPDAGRVAWQATGGQQGGV